MNKKGLACASVVAALCAAALITLFTWPLTDSITWQPLSPPAWWQFELLAGLGFVLSALPSLAIFKFDAFFAANEHLRNPTVGLLVFAEIAALCICSYALVAFLDRRSEPNFSSDESRRPRNRKLRFASPSGNCSMQ